jgi:hypothetical protein
MKRHISLGGLGVQPAGSVLDAQYEKHSSRVVDWNPPHERWVAHATPVPM